MKKKFHITGMVFGNWTVIKELSIPYIRPNERRRTRLMCKCRCKCGVFKNVYKTNLLGGRSKGCVKCTGMKITDKRYLDNELINKNFTWLTVIKRSLKIGARFWLCQCKCGNFVEVTVRDLKDKHRHACYECQPKWYIFKNILNILNRKKGLLKAKKMIRFIKINNRNMPLFLIKCECGKELEMTMLELNNKKSCGCLRKSSKKGEKNPLAKISNKDAEVIRDLRINNPKITTKYLSKLFAISRSQIQEILNNKSYIN